MVSDHNISSFLTFLLLPYSHSNAKRKHCRVHVRLVALNRVNANGQDFHRNASAAFTERLRVLLLWRTEFSMLLD
eukprot:5962364-Amphidinium_carterae.1